MLAHEMGWRCPVCERVWSPCFDGPCTCHLLRQEEPTTSTYTPHVPLRIDERGVVMGVGLNELSGKVCPRDGGDHEWSEMTYTNDPPELRRYVCVRCGLSREDIA